MLEALLTAWRLGTTVPDAVTAAQAKLADGSGPVAAVRAFATVSSLANDVADELEQGVRKGMRVASVVVNAAAFIAEHGAQIREGVDTVLGAAIDWGYQAGKWRTTMAHWEEET